jgi:hypothetical protein
VTIAKILHDSLDVNSRDRRRDRGNGRKKPPEE